MNSPTRKSLYWIAAFFAIVAACSPGARPTGCISGNCQDGEGRYASVLKRVNEDGTVVSHVNEYRGQWKNGFRSGEGTETLYAQPERSPGGTTSSESVEVSRYQGGWLFDRRHGYGYEIRHFENGNKEVYEGYWKDGLRHGEGVEICYDAALGEVRQEYSGQWAKSRKDGYGVELVLRPTTAEGEPVLEWRFSGTWENGEAVSKPEEYTVCGTAAGSVLHDEPVTVQPQKPTRL